MAEIFDTSVDYLLTGNHTDEWPLHNLRLLDRFRALQYLSAEHQETVIKLIDAIVVKSKVENAINPFEEKGE